MSKELLIKKVAEDMQLPEEVVHRIIAFQGEDASKQTKSVKEIEFSGFGKFLLSPTKLQRRIDRWQRSLDIIRARPVVQTAKEEAVLRVLAELKALQ